jgi:hypothetical protein
VRFADTIVYKRTILITSVKSFLHVSNINGMFQPVYSFVVTKKWWLILLRKM